DSISQRLRDPLDVVVIAFASGAEESVECADTIEREHPVASTVVLTGTPTGRLLRLLAHASVCSVLVQGSPAAALVQAVRAASNHQRYFCPVVAEALMHVVADGE
ncbi:MAG: DNA-binding response regulator, partial [Spirochaetaceae bacterium]